MGWKTDFPVHQGNQLPTCCHQYFALQSLGPLEPGDYARISAFKSFQIPLCYVLYGIYRCFGAWSCFQSPSALMQLNHLSPQSWPLLSSQLCAFPSQQHAQQDGIAKAKRGRLLSWWQLSPHVISVFVPKHAPCNLERRLHGRRRHFHGKHISRGKTPLTRPQLSLNPEDTDKRLLANKNSKYLSRWAETKPLNVADAGGFAGKG